MSLARAHRQTERRIITAHTRACLPSNVCIGLCHVFLPLSLSLCMCVLWVCVCECKYVWCVCVYTVHHVSKVCSKYKHGHDEGHTDTSVRAPNDFFPPLCTRQFGSVCLPLCVFVCVCVCVCLCVSLLLKHKTPDRPALSLRISDANIDTHTHMDMHTSHRQIASRQVTKAKFIKLEMKLEIPNYISTHEDVTNLKSRVCDRATSS